MKIRDGDEGDLEGILSLRRLVFGEFEKDKLDADFWKWEFMDGPDGRAFIYIAEEGKRIAGHFADIPRRFSLNGEPALGTLSLDLMVHPDFRRRGIFTDLGTYAARRVREGNGLFMTAFPIRKETIAGLFKIGWEAVEELPVRVYPVRFEGIIERYLRFKPLCYVMAGAARSVYFLLRGFRRSSRGPFMDLEEVHKPDEKFDQFWEKARSLYPVQGVRDPTFLNWRYFTHPSRTYTLYRVVQDGEMTGYIVMRKVELLGFNSAVIVDLLALDPLSLKALIGRGVEWSRRTGVDLLGVMIPKKHPYSQILGNLGFLKSPKAFLFMVYRLAREKVPIRPEAWYVNWGDTDVI